ncbi:PPOX class probable F420-dependent enzyme [Streptomyces sp. SAI-119]|uniref:TIGR03668 family PPOX class F420-dependent oxidoreductase n=1 Tax=Streptomyces sp. SAI-119 TaxID=2940541 RepID=UPI0024770387|nr:TIGR03668 family PPOX class F420-dependent oxidoreductase [Streptomyces sp. SAI-119]MDH6448224.1 PPOX class probable F420-dependent enzyme [Streptomyces sp. SAI-119]
MGLTDQELRERFAQAKVLRLGTADAAGKPHLVPATFAVVGDVVAIAVDHKPKRHTNLKRLRNVEENPAVTLLVDHFDEDWDRLWWVRADGQAQVIENELAYELVDALVDKYEQYREHRPAGPVIRIQVNRWSGWVAKQE